MNNLPINLFDVLLLAVLVVGLLIGRKRGMSLEMFSMIKWIGLALGCGATYAYIAKFIAANTPVSKLTSNIIGYLVAAAVINILFVIFKRVVGGKIIGSDAFGKWEYYLGMPAGMVRAFCALLFGLAILNARLYTVADVKAMRDFQMKNFDSEFFPTLQTVQANVFEKSLTGPPIKKYLNFMLIEPAPPESKQLKRSGEWQMP